MVTTVGTENDLKALVKSFIQLEHDAIAAYETCIDKLEAPNRKEKVREFLGDHERHLRELEDLAREVGAYDPGGGDMKEVLTTGKVKLAGMTGGDGAVLKAMSSNETDTVTAYARGSESSVIEPAHQQIFQRAHEDERRHKEWMEAEAQAA